MDRSDYELRLFQSVTFYIDQYWYLTTVFTKVEVVILRFQSHFGE